MGELEPLATPEEYIARYWDVPDDDAAHLPELLLDATALILSAMPGYEPGSDPVLDRNVKAVCCSVVRRALDRKPGFEGVSQASQTAGSYNQSVSFSNPDGALYLGSSDKAKLGLDSGVVLTAGMVTR